MYKAQLAENLKNLPLTNCSITWILKCHQFTSYGLSHYANCVK